MKYKDDDLRHLDRINYLAAYRKAGKSEDWIKSWLKGWRLVGEKR